MNNFDTNLNLLTNLTEQLLKQGLNYEVTFSQDNGEVGTKVRIFDELTGKSLVEVLGNDLENALFKGLSLLASRVYNNERLSVM